MNDKQNIGEAFMRMMEENYNVRFVDVTPPAQPDQLGHVWTLIKLNGGTWHECSRCGARQVDGLWPGECPRVNLNAQ